MLMQLEPRIEAGFSKSTFRPGPIHMAEHGSQCSRLATLEINDNSPLVNDYLVRPKTELENPIFIAIES